MIRDDIAEVEIDADGRLRIRPSTTEMPLIWRAALEVNWDPARRTLYSPPPREWSYVDWFRHLLAAAADEYGVQLSLAPTTRWSNVSAELRSGIESAAASA